MGTQLLLKAWTVQVTCYTTLGRYYESLTFALGRVDQKHAQKHKCLTWETPKRPCPSRDYAWSTKISTYNTVGKYHDTFYLKYRVNKLTVTRVLMGGKGEGFSGTSIKDIWTKPRGIGWQGWEVGMAGVGGNGEGKMKTTVLKQQ